MIHNARFVHTNLIARDWRRLAAFYQSVFGCEPVPPERNYRGPELDAGTGLKGAHLTGMHLRLPGYGEGGPTLEILSYEVLVPGLPTAVNRPGYVHIAFEVPDVSAAREAVIAAGGGIIGEIVTLTVRGGAQVTWIYVTDPEGNVFELQSWSRQAAG